MYQTIQTKISMVKEPTDKSVSTPEAVTEICSDMATLAQESFQIITVNSHNKMIDRHLITLGIVNASLVHPREVLKPCIIDSATAFIAIHNHPSGNTTPSAEDIRLTKQLVEASKIIDIPMLDHVIIGRKNKKVTAMSLREEGICQFNS